MQPYLFVFAAVETAREAVGLVHQTQLQTCLWLTVSSFPKSRLFANTNMFQLFDLLKSRLYMYSRLMYSFVYPLTTVLSGRCGIKH